MAASVYTRFTTGPDGFISRDDVLRSISHSSSQELPGIIATHLPPRISLPTFQTFLSALTSSPTASDPSFHSSLSAIWPLISPSRNPTPSTKPHPNLSSLRGLAYGFPSSHSHPPPKKPPANTKLEFKRYGVLHDYSVNAIGVPVDYTPPVPKRIGVLERDTGAVVDVETLRNTIKTLLVSKTSTPAPLLRSFRQSDPHSSGTLPISTFTSLLSTHLPLLGRQNVEAAVKHYATSGSTIPYETFISDLVGPKDPLRSFMSDQAFQKLDIHKKGYITLSDLQSAYNPSTDSGYRNGTRTKPQSFQSLIQNGFDGSERMDRITLRDFRRFWGYRGCTVLDDRVFGGLVFETFDGRGRRSM
ncbi:hypothetical protein DFS34DRAFT_467142 [Phlyctochytrium arcticum]|nr:hypothetical protein DFS34DRAFT_467142 [Phlyctochytrium arcticum]